MSRLLAHSVPLRAVRIAPLCSATCALLISRRRTKINPAPPTQLGKAISPAIRSLRPQSAALPSIHEPNPAPEQVGLQQWR